MRTTFPYNLTLGQVMLSVIALPALIGVLPLGNPLLLDTFFVLNLNITMVIAVVAYFITVKVITAFKETFSKKGLFGKDLNKAGEEVDEVSGETGMEKEKM